MTYIDDMKCDLVGCCDVGVEANAAQQQQLSVGNRRAEVLPAIKSIHMEQIHLMRHGLFHMRAFACLVSLV